MNKKKIEKLNEYINFDSNVFLHTSIFEKYSKEKLQKIMDVYMEDTAMSYDTRDTIDIDDTKYIIYYSDVDSDSDEIYIEFIECD